jgi:hypothetical protein
LLKKAMSPKNVGYDSVDAFVRQNIYSDSIQDSGLDGTKWKTLIRWASKTVNNDSKVK